MLKTNVEVYKKHLKVLVKETDDEIVCWNFSFPWLPMEIVLMLFQANFYILSFQKMKKDCSILKISLVRGVCPLNVEIAQFPIGWTPSTWNLLVHFFSNRTWAGPFDMSIWCFYTKCPIHYKNLNSINPLHKWHLNLNNNTDTSKASHLWEKSFVLKHEYEAKDV